jgi:hypothetical protein
MFTFCRDKLLSQAHFRGGLKSLINLGLTQFGPHASGLKITHAALH